MAAADEAEIRRVIGAAEQARIAGRRDEARGFLSHAQAMAPEHPLVLNEVGADRLQAGDASGARLFLERAIEKDDKNPALWLNLATAFRGLNLPDDEMKAL